MSSLRSHFEGMATNKQHQAQSLMPPRSISQFNCSPEEKQTLDRTSLDIPWRPSPWYSSEASKVSSPQSSVRAPMTPTSHSQLSPSPLRQRQRPISMVPLSSSRPFPTVKVDSPDSPPKSHNLPRVHVAPSSSSPTATTPTRPRSYYVTPGYSRLPSSHSPSRVPGQGPQSSKNGDVNNSASKQDIRIFPRNATAKITPPPVNRAEKPKIPFKPSSVLSSKIELDAVVIDERLSPFSTPPSSDESPGLVSFKDTDSQNKRPEWGAARGEKQSYFQASSKNPSIQSKSCKNSGLLAQTSNSLLQHKNGSLPTVPAPRLEAPPGLPPRRDIEKASERSVAITAPSSTISGQGAYRDAVTTRSSTSDTMSTRSSKGTTKSTSEFPPPPRRSAASSSSTSLKASGNVDSQATGPPLVTRHQIGFTNSELRAPEPRNVLLNPVDFPDASSGNRRPPFPKKGVRDIETHYDTRLLDICGAYVCTTGYLTRAWDLSTGEMVMSIGHTEKEIRVTAMAFKPGATADEEGLRLWLGNNYGDLQEVNISTQSIVRTKSSVHGRREIIKIYRHQNSMWTLDEDGKLYVWPPDEKGLPDLQSVPTSYRVPKGHSFSLILKDTLWLAAGKDIRIFRPNPKEHTTFSVLNHPLSQPGVGEVTSGATISGQLNCVYFGHADGKVTVYSTEDYSCLGIINVSVYKISSLAGAGSYLWAGYNTGMIYVYDTRTQPWTTKKDWVAHDNPIASILVDGNSVWRSGLIRVASIGQDNVVRLWDGLLEDDWLGMITAITWSMKQTC